MKPPCCNPEFESGRRGERRRAFTLLEIMVVVAIMGLVLAMGVPAIYGAFHRPPMSQAVRDVLDACIEARAQAILHDKIVAMRIYPGSKRIELVDAGSGPSPEAVPLGEELPSKDAKPLNFNRILSDRITFDLLDVNFYECKDEEVATVRFFPNGICDELTMVLHSVDTAEYRKIKLDLVTATAEAMPFP